MLSTLLLASTLIVKNQGEAILREDVKLGTIAGIVPTDGENALSRLMTTYAAMGASKRLNYLHFVVIIEDLAFMDEKAVASGTTSSRLDLKDSRALLKIVRQMFALSIRDGKSSRRHLEWSNQAGFVAQYIESDVPPRFEFAVDGRSKWMWLDAKGAHKFEDQLTRGIIWMSKRQGRH